MTAPVYHLPHGGGPLPLMGDPSHAGMIDLCHRIGVEIANAGNSVRAVAVVTAHWEEDSVTFSGGANPDLIFDYYNFPPETYAYTYPAPGAPDLAARACGLLKAAGIGARIDAERGYDHGTFVPMMLIRPDADLPVLQISLLGSLDPAAHVAYGRALAPLLADGVALIGSGLSFHNLRALLRGEGISPGADVAFDDWLNETIAGPGLDDAERGARLAEWAKAPGARDCHPREEHLLPLHVCYGAAAEAGLAAKNIFRENLMGYRTSGFRWVSG